MAKKDFENDLDMALDMYKKLMQCLDYPAKISADIKNKMKEGNGKGET